MTIWYVRYEHIDDIKYVYIGAKYHLKESG